MLINLPILSRPFSQANAYNSLTAASALHSAWKLRQDPEAEVLDYIKHNIRVHSPDHLSAMVYFSGMIGVGDPELWNLFEMQVTRTDSVKTMNLTSVFKTFEGFARWTNEAFEVFDMLEMNIDRRVLFENCDPSVLSQGLFVLASLNRTQNAFKKVVLRIRENKVGVSKEEAVKVLWSLAVSEWKPADIKEWLEVYNEIPGCLSDPSQRMLNWSLQQIRFNK